ncbi:DUF998 domain-containing protein [Nocardia sp. ET3-3]|uniref:DUF998 domain-containing protein n=1 Tax=Nocardia terrae TaxID=2675851 RepID=A0A7K1UW49_9NOCA|nr:DUF998 domain-containing protein [Nocardia terrae]MVU78088.1 DUF998 domain-containing protein [Nocardia terrae]
MTRTGWPAACALALGGIGYSSWVLEGVLNTGVDPVNSFLSELYAEGKPHRDLFATTEQITGLLVVVAAVCGLAGRPRRSRTTIGWVALLCFGAATIADALVPLGGCRGARSCTASRGLFPQLYQPHALTSTLAVTSIALAVLVFTASAWRNRRWPLVRTAGLVVLSAGVAATLWMLVGDNLPGHHALGIAQRAQVGSISLWLLLFAAALARENRTVTRTRRRRSRRTPTARVPRPPRANLRRRSGIRPRRRQS